MATLAVSRRLYKRLRDLPPQVQDEVANMSRLFLQDSKAPSLNLEPYRGSLDPRFRTVRLTQGLRGVVWALEGDHYVLDDVASHDEAEQAARRRRCQVHPGSGCLQIVEVETAPDVPDRSQFHAADTAYVQTTGPSQDYLFTGISDKEFRQVGISPAVARVLRRLRDEADLDALAAFGPKRDLRAAYMLASGYSVEHAYAELAALPDEEGEGDIANAIQRAVGDGQLFVVRDERGLLEVLGQSFDAWRIFLHASQRDLAYKPSFGGPVRVIGGPGTGKTVVALHRAQHLSEAMGFFEETSGKRIVFTTFSASLARAVEENLRRLGGDALCARVDVVTADTLASRIVQELTSERLGIATEREALAMLEPELQGARITALQVFREWEQVVLAHDIRSLPDYLALERRGTGRGLQKSVRTEIWRAIQQLEAALRQARKETFLQRARRAADAMRTAQRPLFDHGIVDEAQDLHAAHWRMLRAAVRSGQNDLFIVGDAHQRIYRHRTPLTMAGIDCRGRSRRLVLNYRTTAGIIDWAKQLLPSSGVDDLDDGSTDLGGYRSVMDGPAPTVRGYESQEAERSALRRELLRWRDDSIPLDAVAVVCRTNALCEEIAEWLCAHGLPAVHVKRGTDGTTKPCISVMTMHRVKGLEFRAVALPGVSAGVIPQPELLEEAGEDEEKAAEIRERERRLLFTACTRPRERLWVSWTGVPSSFLDPVLRADVSSVGGSAVLLPTTTEGSIANQPS